VGQPYVTNPDTGGTFVRTTTIPVTWTVPSPVDTGTFRVYVRNPNGTETLLTTQNAVAAQTDYTYNWTITQPVGTGYNILIWYRNAAGSYLYFDSSDVPFDIGPPPGQPTVTNPNTATSFAQGVVVPVQWDAPSPVSSGTFQVYLKKAGGSLTLLTTQAAVAGQTPYTYNWTVAHPVATGYDILVWYRNAVGSWLYSDLSDAPFAITAGSQ